VQTDRSSTEHCAALTKRGRYDEKSVMGANAEQALTIVVKTRKDYVRKRGLQAWPACYIYTADRLGARKEQPIPLIGNGSAKGGVTVRIV
jgi:hypothetical protein